MIKQQSAVSIPLRAREYLLINWRMLISGGLVLLALLYCYAGVLATLARQWLSNDVYSYGFLIPLISISLVWMRRDRFTHVERSPHDLGGLCIVLAGTAMFLSGTLGGSTVVPELSLIVTITGIVFFLLGIGVLKIVWFPISYLLFMIPAWDIITDRLHYPFQLFSATIGVTLLQLVGIPVHQEANYVMLPRITLEVAKVCSGVNYLIAVLAIGIPLAYLFLQGWARRVLLVCFGVLIAMLGNGIRVARIGLFSYYGIGNNVHGPFHMLQGLSVAMVGYVALFSGLCVLAKRETPLSRSNVDQPPKSPDQAVIDENQLNQRHGAGTLRVVLCVLILFSSRVLLHAYSPEPVSLKNSLNQFPRHIGKWEGRDVPPKYTGFQELSVDHELSRVYRKPTGETLWFYIGYFNEQNQKKKLISYKTRNLYANTIKTTVELNSRDSININKSTMTNDPQHHSLMLFWFDLNGRIVSDRYLAKFYTLWDAMTRRRTNGAVIMLVSEYTRQEGDRSVDSQGKEFIKEIVPLLNHYLPKAKETS